MSNLFFDAIKMKRTSLIAALSLVSVSSVAMASDFNGLSLQAGLGLNSAQTTLQNYSPDGKVSNSNASGRIGLHHSQSMGAFNLGAGVFYVMGDQKSGALRSFAADTGGEWSDSFKLKNVWGISIEPGFNLSDTTQVYGKLSYVRAKGNNVYNYVVDGEAGAASRNHNGVGVGAGVKFKLSGKIYGMLEVEQINFNKQSYYSDVPETYKPRLLQGTIGVGYRF
jgi:opacity protein-like surface antigen